MNEDRDVVVRLDIPAGYRWLSILSGCIGEMLARIDNIADRESVVYAVQLAAHETCSNIVGHAYGGDPTGRIGVTIRLTHEPRRLEIEMRDTGRKFDPERVAAPNLEEPQIHGYGLFIARNLLDELTYSPRSSENNWRLTKYL